MCLFNWNGLIYRNDSFSDILHFVGWVLCLLDPEFISVAAGVPISSSYYWGRQQVAKFKCLTPV